MEFPRQRICSHSEKFADGIPDAGNVANKSPYWFPAKRYGWGWGIPTVWQGWVVLIVFFCLLIAGALWLLPSLGQVAFVLYTALLCAVLIAVCWVKGEPPGWHWGGK